MNTLMHELSGDLVGFWKTQTIYAAVKLGVINELPGSIEKISLESQLSKHNCLRLLRGLWELNIVNRVSNTEGDNWELTPKGQLLKSSSSSCMAAAAEVWANSHYKEWQSLAKSLRSDSLPQTSYFSTLSKDPVLLNIYQNALSGYAKHDYHEILELPFWYEHKCVLDAGGGNGILLSKLLSKFQHLEAILIELPEVIAQIPEEVKTQERMRYIAKDFFTPWDITVDAIIFSRVLHDWPDQLALALLQRAKQSLTPEGKIYVIEMIVDQNSPKGSLLDLNMFVMTGGCERSLQDWQGLFYKSNLNLSKITELSSIVSILELTL